MLEALKSLKNSKALQSELMILQEHSIIKETDDYISVRSLTNPHFHWGNFLIFDHAPKAHDIALWEEYFCREFPEFINQHRAFTWIKGDDVPTFVPSGYHLERMVCLTAKDVQNVKQINPDVILRRIHSDEEWIELEQKQLARLKSEVDVSLREFTKQRLKDYRSLVEKGFGD